VAFLGYFPRLGMLYQENCGNPGTSSYSNAYSIKKGPLLATKNDRKKTLDGI
jgi:hypothetical protein